MNNENNFNGEISTKSKSKKTRIIIISVVALIIILIGVGVYAAINSDPKVKVFKALKTTGEDFEKKQTLTEEIAGKDYLKNLEENGIKQNMKFTLGSTNYKELQELNGVGISIDSSIDQKNKKFMLNIGGQYKGTSVAQAELYTDNEKIMLSVPEIYNAWFTCDTENIKQQYNDSYFAENGQLLNNEVSLKLFGDNDTKELSGKELADAIVKGYLNANKEKLTTLGKNIKVEKSKATKNIEIDGANQDCTGYDVVISGQDAETFIEGIYDYALEDQEIKNIITRSAKYSYLQGDKQYDTPEAMVDDIYKEMKDAGEKFKNSFTCADVNTVVYIDKKGRAVSIELNTDINLDDEKVAVTYSSDFKGKDNVGDIIDMSMELSNNGERIKIDLDNTTTTKDDTVNEDTNLVLSSNDQPLNIKIDSKYNIKSGEFDASADLNAEGEGLTASCNGNVQYDKSNKKLEVDFDKIDFNTNINSEQINVSLDGSYAISPIDATIEEPTGEKLELFKLSENKFVEIAQEMQKNAMELSNAFK